MTTETLEELANFRRIPGTNVFRSARPDKMTKEDVEKLKNYFGIKKIFDFRTCHLGTKEYKNARGNKFVDDVYETYRIDECGDQPGEVEFVKINKRGDALQPDAKKKSIDAEYVHFLFNVQSNYFKHILNRLPIYWKYILLVLLFIDKMFNTLFFFKWITHVGVNPEGMVGNYIDSIESSGKNYCTVLKMLSEKENTPALVNCTLGKDRTGVLAALLMLIVGADKDAVAKDYAATHDNFSSYVGDIVILFELVNLHKSFADAKYDTMIKFLEYIDNRYGSADGYLNKIGFIAKDREKLIANIKQ